MAYQPKSYRKFVATTATAAMVASAVAPVVSAAAGFTDVASQYKDAVDFLVSAGVKGKSETKFGVYDEITRLDAAVILAKVLKLDVDNAKDAGFTDVPKDRAKYVNALVEAGVLNGKAAGKFGAYDKLTRAEMAKIIANAYKLKGDDVTLPFTDVNDTWAPYVKALYKNGITKGKSETKFGANDNITRGDFAVFVYRAANVDVAPQVVSVSAINAKEVQIKFNKPIKKDTVIESNGSLVDGVVTFNALDGATAVDGNTSTAVLSEDGKTLTITANTTFNGKYVVTVAADSVQTTDGKFVEKYTSEVLTFKDEVRPTLLGVSYPVNGVATFTFSEPLNVTNAADIEAALEIRDANGNVVSDTGLVTLASDKKSFDLDISSFTVDKNYTVTLAGLSDFAGNLITPNPISTTVVNKILDNVAPTVEKVEAVKTGVLKVTLSEKVKVQQPGNVLGTYDVNNSGTPTNIVLGTNATLDSTGKVITITDATNFTGIKTITLNGFKDLSGNTLASPVSKLLEFKADTTKPAYVSHEIKQISGAQYLIVKYNEEISVDNSVGDLSYTYVDSNQVTRSGSITNDATNVVAYDTDGDSVNDAIKISLAGLNPGNYTLSLPAGLAVDTATPTANTSDAKSISFTLGTLNDTGKPFIVDDDSNPDNGYSGITVQSSEDYVTVVFNENLSAATALNVANYTVEGQQVFESAIFDGNQYTVKLKLKPNVITVTGLRNFTIQNVTDVAGNVMNPVTTKVLFKENVKPVVTGASLIAADTIKVTFSEDMLEANLEDTTPDFKVLVDGVEKSVSNLAYDATTKSLNITFTPAVSDLSKPISLEVLSGNNVVDATTPGNKLATTGTIVVSK
ncbi:S-layer homology domain-containing protein [Saccharococcus caldoxylosilyticus]|uniref:S-layer homology domain-containing protein n=1 Tax=Saccharococcus caldoxylosilyticus TaxID=81408 RepID=UPI001C4DF3AE|nr:S-layer homology domain-containing protein [Parageobacillus caldoxylosilyticus]QXJ38758.1 S-layer protein precursor [Parageobacillus caldoxylosilyticus]